MSGLASFLLAAPKWPYLVFAMIVWFGVRAFKPRSTPIWRMAMIPAVFIAWGTASLLLRANMSGFAILEWIVAAAAGTWAGWYSCRSANIQVDPMRGMVTFPGSVLPLIRYILIFAVKYALAVTYALRQDFRVEVGLVNILFSGAFAGYFAGRLFVVLRSYRLGRSGGLNDEASHQSSLVQAPN
jgi:hypothetical protein